MTPPKERKKVAISNISFIKFCVVDHRDQTDRGHENTCDQHYQSHVCPQGNEKYQDYNPRRKSDPGQII